MGERRHLGHRVVQNLDEDAAEAETDRRPEQTVLDDAGVDLGHAGHHGLDQHLVAAKAGLAHVRDERSYEDEIESRVR